VNGVTDDQLRALALKMSRTDELDAEPGKKSYFRVCGGPIFAVFHYSKATVCIYGLDKKRMAALVRDDPKTFKMKLKGAFVDVKLAGVDVALLKALLREAHTANDPRRKKD